MKKTLIILMVSILCILFTTLGVSASADVDNIKYIPKVITTANGYKMMFDSELAHIAREMSSDAYGIAYDSNVQDIAKTFIAEGFTDIRQSHLFDEPFMGVFSNNFLVGVKTFEVDGVQKHVLAIAFRGTQVKDGFDYADLFTDASILGLNGFHSGFYAAALKAYDTLYDMEFPSLKNEDGSSMTFSDYLVHSGLVESDYYILVTGHSLGGAVANIFAGDIISQFGKSNVMCYTFASPIVCSPTKAKEYDAYNIFNIINTNDAVPKVGYNLFSGVRLGNDLKVSVTDSEESAHNLKVTYEKATNQVINKMDSLYPYIHRVCTDTTDEIHIHTNCSLEKRRFTKYLGDSDFSIIRGASVTVNTDIKIGGNFNNNGSLIMNDNKGYILINGDYVGNYRSNQLTAGTIEIKGNMSYCNGYKASGTHKTILSGENGQQINLTVTGSGTGNFNILEVTNTSDEGVNFTGKAFVYGELYSDSSSKIVNGTNLIISQTATIRELWNGDLTAAGWTCNQDCSINGSLKVDYITSDPTTTLNANVKVKGNVEIDVNNSGRNITLEIGAAKVEIGGNFTNNKTLKMTDDNGYILVKGSCNKFIHSSNNALTAGTIEIKGNMNNCGGYRTSGTHKTILSGENGQSVDLENGGQGNFNILEIINTSEEGVKFIDEVNILLDVLQPVGTKITKGSYVKLQNKTAFVDYGDLNSQINTYNGNAREATPTWLDYERYCKFALNGDKAFALNETITDTSFDCDLYFSNEYDKASATVIIAFYDGENRFVQMASNPVSVKVGKIDFSIDFEDKDYSKYKLMIWEDFDSMKPLMSVER